VTQLKWFIRKLRKLRELRELRELRKLREIGRKIYCTVLGGSRHYLFPNFSCATIRQERLLASIYKTDLEDQS